jgi:peptidoglycan/LPS O-acetylase OafA/YrhL
VRGLFFANWASIPDHNVALMFLYFVTSLGRQAVIVFFVLSGFFIGWAVISAARSGRWSWRGYLVRRLSRLGIVLLPALALTALWDFAGIGLFGAQSAYLGGRLGEFVLSFRVVDHLTPQAFVGNTFFLQGILGIPTFGSNAPLWSLSYEFWYYMLFPLMICAYLAQGRMRWLFGAGAGLTLVLIGPTIAAYYLVWLLGVAIVVCALRLGPRRQFVPAWALIPAGLLLLAVLVMSQRHSVRVSDGVLSVACAIFLGIVVLKRGPAAWTSGLGRLYASAARRLAGSSYTLYLVHLPMLIFLRAALNQTLPWLPDASHLAIALMLVFAVLAYALGVASLTEARTEQLRHWLVGRV